MHILLVHNYYQVTGGEDVVFHNERELLKKKGHNVQCYVVNNNNIKSFLGKFIATLNVPFSFKAYKQALNYLSKNRPDLVHVHNYFPLLSPSFFYSCKKLKIPIVHTLHNYRAVCPSTLLMSHGEINETSIKQASWWTVKARIYRGSVIGSFALACMVELHKKIGTWTYTVNRFIALTEFSKSKYIDAGWPGNKILVKPNFIEDPKFRSSDKKGGYAIFVGRLSEEKGIRTLIKAWDKIDFPLKIVGDGPLKQAIKSGNNPAISLLGLKSRNDVLSLLHNANFVIFPSTCLETFGMVLIEAFACGTPVIGSNLGSTKDIVKDGVTGYQFQAGDSQDLAKKVHCLINDQKLTRQMGKQARKEYEQNYTPDENYAILMDIYEQAVGTVSK